MEYISQETRGLLFGCLKSVGFSMGEAECRVEGLQSEEELEFLINYIFEHKDVSLDEIRIIHTNLVSKHDATRIGSADEFARTMVVDQELEKTNLMLRRANINWSIDGIEKYLLEIKALRNLDVIEFRKPITFFVGENGSGKSTLLEAIAIEAGYNPEGGTKSYCFSTRDTHSTLHSAIRLVRGTRKPAWGVFLRAESFYNVATEAEIMFEEGARKMFDRYGEKSFHKQSHGESFYNMLKGDITDNGLYFLDEPEAALSPRRQLNLLGLLHKYANRGAQFIIATHSPILLACPDACIYEFSDKGIEEKSYEETDIYKIVSGFVKDRDSMLKKVIINEQEF